MTQEDCAAETTRIEAEETAAGMRRRGRRIRPHLQRPEVGLGALGCRRRRHPGADRRRAPRGGRRRDRPSSSERSPLPGQASPTATAPWPRSSVAGVAAVAYDHFDSRAGDPQLHTHVVIANKVLTVMDGRWRSLDGRPVFASRHRPVGALQRAARGSARRATSASSGSCGSAGADRNPQMGDRRRQRRPDHRVLQPHPRDRAQEGRAHRRVRRPPRSDAVGEDHRRAPRPGDAGHTPAEGGPIARRPDGRVATARRRAVGDRADGVVTRR